MAHFAGNLILNCIIYNTRGLRATEPCKKQLLYGSFAQQTSRMCMQPESRDSIPLALGLLSVVRSLLGRLVAVRLQQAVEEVGEVPRVEQLQGFKLIDLSNITADRAGERPHLVLWPMVTQMRSSTSQWNVWSQVGVLHRPRGGLPCPCVHSERAGVVSTCCVSNKPVLVQATMHLWCATAAQHCYISYCATQPDATTVRVSLHTSDKAPASPLCPMWLQQCVARSGASAPWA